MKNLLVEFKNRGEQAENKINECENRTSEIIESEEQREKRLEKKKNEQSLRDFRNTIK